MAEKYIVEVPATRGIFNRDKDGAVQRSVYPIVYENKTYWFCKVNGTDELKTFNKSVANHFTISSDRLFFEVQKKNCTNEYITKVINEKIIPASIEAVIRALESDLSDKKYELDYINKRRITTETKINALKEKIKDFKRTMGVEKDEKKEHEEVN